MSLGTTLVSQCKEHLLRTMHRQADCRPKTGKGLGYRAIEELADFDLWLAGQNGWFTHSLLRSLAEEGKLEVVPGTERRRRWRLR